MASSTASAAAASIAVWNSGDAAASSFVIPAFWMSKSRHSAVSCSPLFSMVKVASYLPNWSVAASEGVKITLDPEMVASMIHATPLPLTPSTFAVAPVAGV